ncbi:hypothetical protein [Cohnella sp.]|uniref:hypothetical protein n=1 Tax=Cohnella sp. TaxID=1883426 RepID=UPI003569417B
MEIVLEHMEEGVVLFERNGTAYYANQSAKNMGLYPNNKLVEQQTDSGWQR